MYDIRFSVRVGLLVVAGLFPAASALAQTPGSVRVVNRTAPIQRWFRQPVTEVLAMAPPGTTLEVLDEERGWYWVIVPPDAYGTRRSGWIRASNVEPLVAAAAVNPRGQSGLALVPAADTGAAAEDRVSITTEQQGEGGSSRANAGTPARSYTFEDLHFNLNRYELRPEDMDTLRAVVAALKGDPLLVVNIEGYTCSLGTAEYNLALGARRANAVKAYLVGEGIAAERLRTISLGEDRAKHDNSREETRRLNRRVAVVPNAQP